MKVLEDSLYPEDWKNRARKDWERVNRNLRDKDAEAAGYFLQQSLEKYLKSFLLMHGWQLRKIHTLHTLLDDAIIYNIDLEPFRDLCERVSGYYFTERYPVVIKEELTCDDIENDIEESEQFIKVLFGEEI